MGWRPIVIRGYGQHQWKPAAQIGWSDCTIFADKGSAESSVYFRQKFGFELVARAQSAVHQKHVQIERMCTRHRHRVFFFTRRYSRGGRLIPYCVFDLW